MDLWSFEDVKELERNIADLPDTILKEQINLLGEKTNYVLYGKPMFVKVRSEEIDFKVATLFNIVVPSLDNYTKTLLIMYSNPEEEYPIAITVGKEFAEDKDTFRPNYTCDNKEDFIETIRKILGSEDTIPMRKWPQCASMQRGSP